MHPVALFRTRTMIDASNLEQRQGGWSAGSCAILIGTALIVSSVVIRLMTAAIEMPWFDVDPTSIDHPAIGLLPSARFGFDILMLIGAGLILGGQFVRGQGASWWVLLLAALPVPVLLWHGWNDPADLEQGSLWFSSVLAAVALAHVARMDWIRAVGLCILLAGLAPLVIKSIVQVAWDIPATIAYFDANRAEEFAMLGIEPGSSAARVFERRLRNAVPTGWFSSTNLLASVMAAGASAWFAITVLTVRKKMTSGLSGLCALISLSMICIVIATESIGGWVVMLLGLCMASACLFLSGWQRVGGWVAVALVVLALLAAPLGSLIGELPGIRSFIVRSGYVSGADQIFLESPWRGVGPSGFQAAWLQVRDAGSPEEIVSPHSMPWDWIATVGVLSLSWMALVVATLMWGPRRLEETGTAEASWGLSLRSWVLGIAVLTIVLGLMSTSEIRYLGGSAVMVHVIGWSLFLVMAILLASLWRQIATGMRIGAWVAAVVLVVHAQVEMSIEQATTVPWILAMLGISAPVGRPGHEGRHIARAWAGVAFAACVCLAGMLFVIGYLPAAKTDRIVSDLGWSLHESSGLADGRDVLMQRRSAAEGLLEAARIRDDDRLRLAAADQLLDGMVMSSSLDQPAPSSDIDAAGEQVVDISMDVFERTGSVEAGHIVISALLSNGEPAGLSRALPVAVAVSELDPVGLWSQRHLADVLWERGEQDRSIAVYERVLAIDAAREIDSMRRLTDRDRVDIEQRVSDFRMSGTPD